MPLKAVWLCVQLKTRGLKLITVNNYALVAQGAVQMDKYENCEQFSIVPTTPYRLIVGNFRNLCSRACWNVPSLASVYVMGFD